MLSISYKIGSAILGVSFCCALWLGAVQAADKNASGNQVVQNIGGSGGSYAASPDCQWPDNRSLDAVVAVAGEDGSYASGVVINRNRVLTAAHALSSAHRVFVRIEDQYRPAQVVMIDRAEDLAMLSVDTSDVAPLHVAQQDPSADVPVWAVGFPRANGKATTQGRLTRNNAGSLHASASIDLGQSGGGLLYCTNGAYSLAGMLRGYGAYVQGDRFVKLRNHSISVGASTIQRFFNALPHSAVRATTRSTAYSAALVTR